MKYTYNFNSQSIIYDGDEQGFYNFECELHLSAINKILQFKYLSTRPIWEDRTGAIFESISVIKGMKKIEYPQDPFPSYKNGVLDIYSQGFNFNNIMIVLVMAIGGKEVRKIYNKKLGYVIH
ncbi:hypothetical protein ACKTG8_004202 [Cronobacter sakazakii]|uniref:hypothetical protein n=1 Tax=Cronobacter sakazakii TaxID=28141 RepID=UPI0006CF825A|nr:hypothetical protein [Cronobacter sakazakii]EGT5763973.1 hypothetical protein [Cronobacter sakazakii]EIX1616068.1 hypothetical protein [Cronobacter sakazakii]EJG0761985.1 hypothetical protein [Cronobacter sakazakii]ELY2619261.1 hypothetical protein [Cronobacter sakazakii]ELY3537423.1 hypothetical protein [Cronobacter sakazakii]